MIAGLSQYYMAWAPGEDKLMNFQSANPSYTTTGNMIFSQSLTSADITKPIKVELMYGGSGKEIAVILCENTAGTKQFYFTKFVTGTQWSTYELTALDILDSNNFFTHKNSANHDYMFCFFNSQESTNAFLECAASDMSKDMFDPLDNFAMSTPTIWDTNRSTWIFPDYRVVSGDGDRTHTDRVMLLLEKTT